MPRVTITIEGDLGELATVLRKIGELKETKQAGVATGIVGSEAEWTEKRVLEVWKDLTEECKKVLIEIAKAEELSWKQLQEKLGWTPNKIGGSLSSLGAQLRNHGLKGITYPLVENNSDGYNLLPVWRKTVLEQIEER